MLYLNRCTSHFKRKEPRVINKKFYILNCDKKKNLHTIYDAKSLLCILYKIKKYLLSHNNLFYRKTLRIFNTNESKTFVMLQ